MGNNQQTNEFPLQRVQKRPLDGGESSSSKRTRSLPSPRSEDNIQVPNSQPTQTAEVTGSRRLATQSLRRSSYTSDHTTQVSFSEAAKFGLLALVDAIYDFEVNRGHTFTHQFDLQLWRRAGIQLLAAIPNKLLECLIQGNIAQEWVRGSEELVELFGEYESPESDDQVLFEEESDRGSSHEHKSTVWQDNGNLVAPGHYIRVLIDRSGNPPTPVQLRSVIDAIRIYAGPAPHNRKLGLDIDNVKRPGRSSEEEIKLGEHYFLCTKKHSRRNRREDRVTQVFKFCDAVQHRLDQVDPENLDKPDVRPLSYVGYAKEVNKRIVEHEDSDRSSFLMQLLEHTCQMLGLSHSFETFITSYATNADEAKFGEIIINALAQSYHDTGFGVAPHPAGMNCSSAEFKGTDIDEVNNMWRQAINFRHQVTPFGANMEREQVLRGEKEKFELALKKKRDEEIQVRQRVVLGSMPEVASFRKLQKDTTLRSDTPECLREHFEGISSDEDQKIQVWEQAVADARRSLEKLNTSS